MTRMERRKRRQRQIRRRVALAFTALAIVAAVLLGGKAEAESPSASVDQTVAEDTTQALYSESVKLVYEMPMQIEDMESSSQAAVEDPKESEKIEQALLEQGYLHQEIPLSFDLQCHLKTVCEEYGVPYHIALGVIQAESSFTADATNGICFGYMQINKINAEWLSKEIGVTDLSEPYFEIHNGAEPSAYLWEKGQAECKEVDGYESCEKFETKTALFTGVFVGVTTLCTELFCDWNDHPYSGGRYQCSSINPKPFAIVYYAENKKRLVPMDSIKKVEA